LAYKAEHVVDLKSDVILAAEIYPADHADTQTLVDSVMEAIENVKQAGAETEVEEVVADKGYHAAETIELADDLNFRTYIPERKKQYRSRWTDKPAALKRAVYANRRRLKRAKSRQLQRWRSERCERTFAHVCDTGGMRRSWLKEVVNVSKRYLIAAAAHNLGRILRKLFGVGKPRTLQDLADLAVLVQLLTRWSLMHLARWRRATPPDGSRFAHAAAAKITTEKTPYFPGLLSVTGEARTTNSACRAARLGVACRSTP
jgi:transposase